MKEIFRGGQNGKIPANDPKVAKVLFLLKKGTNELDYSSRYWTGGTTVNNIKGNMAKGKRDYVLFTGTPEIIRKEVKKSFPNVDVVRLVLDKTVCEELPLINASKKENPEKEGVKGVPVCACYSNEGDFCFATQNETGLDKAENQFFKYVTMGDLIGSIKDTLYAVSLSKDTFKEVTAESSFDTNDYVIVPTLEKAVALKDALHGTHANYFGSRKSTEKRGHILTRDEFLCMAWKGSILSSKYAIKVYESLDEVNSDFANSRIIPEFQGEFEKNTVYIYTDGSASAQRAVCGWAYVVFRNGQEIYSDKAPYPVKDPRRAVHMAEFLAVLNALDFVISNNVRKVVLLYDNSDVFNVAYATNSADIKLFWKYTGYIYEKWAEMERLGINFKMEHVKAHSGIEGNVRADALAKSAMQAAGKYDF